MIKFLYTKYRHASSYSLSSHFVVSPFLILFIPVFSIIRSIQETVKCELREIIIWYYCSELSFIVLALFVCLNIMMCFSDETANQSDLQSGTDVQVGIRYYCPCGQENTGRLSFALRHLLYRLCIDFVLSQFALSFKVVCVIVFVCFLLLLFSLGVLCVWILCVCVCVCECV